MWHQRQQEKGAWQGLDSNKITAQGWIATVEGQDKKVRLQGQGRAGQGKAG